MNELIERLRDGCVLRPKRWSGDTNDDLGGSIDEAATDSLLREAAAALEAAREDAAAVNRVLAVVEEFEGCTGAGYRYMAANIRSAIDQARGKGVADA